MHNFPIKRKQSDAAKKRIRVALAPGDTTTPARQEFRQEADINYILGRFGVQSLRPATYGDYDYDIDLQTALSAIEQAERGYDALPPEMKNKYQDWQSVISALADGTKVSEIREFLKDTKLSTQEKDDATRPDAESGGKGDSGKPAESK